MLVEDEDPVRLFGARALRGKGYRVIEASTGEAALKLFEEGEADDVDLLVTDIVMPELDGPSLIIAARVFRPELPVVCVSGYAESAFRDKLTGIEDVHFLPKPFTLAQLAGKVKDVIP
ncbi:MAG: response regulator [Alphaproteobacteria bacterium]